MMLETDKPAVFRSNPVLLAIIPFPTPEITPPETRTYFILANKGLNGGLPGEYQGGSRRFKKIDTRYR